MSAIAQKNARGKPVKKQAVPGEADAARSVARPESGHIFNLNHCKPATTNWRELAPWIARDRQESPHAGRLLSHSKT